MKGPITISALLGLLTLAFEVQCSSAATQNIVICRGTCDASAVVLLGNEHFVVADDEDNILRVYSRTRGGMPLHTVDLSSFLRVDVKSPEVDIEGAAPLGNRVYWISSQSRNKNARERVSRQRFFATTLSMSNGTADIKPVGRPYLELLSDLINDPRLEPFDLATAARRAPKTKDGLNIEGLCATPDGHLLLGFRNPIPKGKALVVPLLNPADLTDGKPARLGNPLLLELGGLGIRSLAWAGTRYFIIAGSYDAEGPSFLYEWSGGTNTPCRLPRAELAGLNPEAIECLTESGVERLLMVSDDGALKIGGKDCKDVKDRNMKYFRATTIDL